MARLEPGAPRASRHPGQCSRCGRGPIQLHYAGGVCHRCHDALSGRRDPYYLGPCLNGCGAPGRRRSGYCKRCYGLVSARRRRFMRLLGVEIDAARVCQVLGRVAGGGPAETEALDAVVRLIEQLGLGALQLKRNPWYGRRRPRRDRAPELLQKGA